MNSHNSITIVNNDPIVWNIDIRNKVSEIEERIRKMPGAMIGDNKYCPLTHTFADGIYVREIFMPKGTLIVSKIHKHNHPYFVLKGDVSVLTEQGIKRIKGPFHDITPRGTKRLLYIHEDTTWITVHSTKETDLAKVEEELIAKSFEELDMEIIDTDVLENDFLHIRED